MAVDERTLEALLSDPAIQLVGRLVGSRNRQGGKAREPFWIRLHHVSEKVVRLAGDRDLLCHVRLLDPGGIQREHLHVDVGGIHLSHATWADLLKLLDNPHTVGTPAAELLHETPARPGNKSRAREMLFKGDGPQFGSYAWSVAPGLAIVLCNRHRRHRGRSGADGSSVDEVAAVHESPPQLKAPREAEAAGTCDGPVSIVGTTLSHWTMLGNRAADPRTALRPAIPGVSAGVRVFARGAIIGGAGMMGARHAQAGGPKPADACEWLRASVGAH